MTAIGSRCANGERQKWGREVDIECRKHTPSREEKARHRRPMKGRVEMPWNLNFA